MYNPILILFLLIISGCSTFKTEIVDCPRIISSKKTAEAVVKSDKNIPIYIGIRGVKAYCTVNNDEINIELTINVRAIRRQTSIEDEVPVIISVVSLDNMDNEYQRDSFSYSQFMLKNSRVVDRKTEFDLNVPQGGKILIGIK